MEEKNVKNRAFMGKKHYQIPQLEVAAMDAAGSVMVTSINTLPPGPNASRRNQDMIID